MKNDGLRLYEVSWNSGCARVRCSGDAVDAATRIRERYGWRRSGSYMVDAKTRGLLTCEMPVERPNCGRILLVSVLQD